MKLIGTTKQLTHSASPEDTRRLTRDRDVLQAKFDLALQD